MWGFILGMLGLYMVFIMYVGDKLKTSSRNRRYQIDNATHNYNDALQDELNHKDIFELSDMIGVYWIDYANSRFGSCANIYGECIRLTMIKELMEKEGYDYRPKEDTLTNREYCKKHGFPSYEGTQWEGL